MSEEEATNYNYRLLTEAQKTKSWVRVLAHGRSEDCLVTKISWDDMEDRVFFTTNSGNQFWSVGLPAITKLQPL